VPPRRGSSSSLPPAAPVLQHLRRVPCAPGTSLPRPVPVPLSPLVRVVVLQAARTSRKTRKSRSNPSAHRKCVAIRCDVPLVRYLRDRSRSRRRQILNACRICEPRSCLARDPVGLQTGEPLRPRMALQARCVGCRVVFFAFVKWRQFHSPACAREHAWGEASAPSSAVLTPRKGLKGSSLCIGAPTQWLSGKGKRPAGCRV